MLGRLAAVGPTQRFLVAGGAGFIGSHLNERLLAEGHEVIAVDNFITGDWRNLAPFHDHPRFMFIAHDVVKPMHSLLALDWILHFASPASPPKDRKHGLQTMRSNAEGTYRLLNLAHEHGAGFLLASTSEVYGDPSEHPQRETYWGHVNPIGPRAVYDEGKRYAEALATSYHDSFGVAVRIVRIFNTYGPRMQRDDGRVVVNFIHQALAGRPLTIYGDGTQTRSYQFIDDLVEGVLRSLEVDYTEPINLGNPQEHSVVHLAELIRDLTGSSSPMEFHPQPKDDPRQRRPDISLARSLLEWTPEVELASGLSATIDHVRVLFELGAGAARRKIAPRARPEALEPVSAAALDGDRTKHPSRNGHARAWAGLAAGKKGA